MERMGVIFMGWLPNTKSKCQLADVIIFGDVKSKMERIEADWILQNPGNSARESTARRRSNSPAKRPRKWSRAIKFWRELAAPACTQSTQSHCSRILLAQKGINFSPSSSQVLGQTSFALCSRRPRRHIQGAVRSHHRSHPAHRFCTLVTVSYRHHPRQPTKGILMRKRSSRCPLVLRSRLAPQPPRGHNIDARQMRRGHPTMYELHLQAFALLPRPASSRFLRWGHMVDMNRHRETDIYVIVT